MLITTFYLAMTFINAWRMRSLKSHLLKFMSWKSSAVLYKFSSETISHLNEVDNEGPDEYNKFMEVMQISVVSNSISPLKAKLIVERKVHYITDVIEITEATRMCRLRPIQFIDINRWVSLANGLPFWTNNIFQQLDPTPKLCVFIECEMEPCIDETLNDIVPLESLGQVWAWRADKNLEFIVVIPFNKLLELSYKFLYGSLLINEKLPVTRIQTVYATGVPYVPDDVKIYPLRKLVCEAHKSSCGIDWAYYSAILKQMYIDVLPHTVKTSTTKAVSDNNTNMPIDQATNTDTIEYTNANHSDRSNQEATQKLIRELSQELSAEPIQESSQDKKLESLQKQPQNSVDKQETGIQSSQKQPQEYVDKQEKAIESLQKQHQEYVDKQEKAIESLHKQHQEYVDKQEKAIELLQKQSQESVDPQERKRRPLQKQSQESRSEPIQESRPKLTHQSKQESLQKNSEEPKQETSQETHEATIVRSEVVAIRQKLSPSRKRNKNNTGNVATTIESVTTHRRVTTLVPPTQGRQTPSPERSNTVSGDKRRTELPKSNALNVLVYSESLVAKNNLIATLKNVLDPDRYTIYPVSLEVLCQGAWKGKVAMIAVVGNTGDATAYLLKYFLDGGRLLAICSDLLQSVVPYYRTAEIRENEIVQFSYDKWKSVKMKHHVLCFQASPAKKQFSSESDRHVMEHELVIDVLANEETWRTPSLIQVVDDTNHGVSIFSQIHLETNPTEYLGEDGPNNNRNRYEILLKILGEIISLHVKETNEMATLDYTEGYIFGDDKTIQSFLSGLSPGKDLERHLKISNMEIEWLAPGQEPTHPPSQSYMPVRLSQVPKTFSYDTYLQNLTSSSMGRVVLYTDVVGSTAAWGEMPLLHGLAVVARRQLQGRGRSQNHFISPPGQAILTLQVWQKLTDTLALTQNIAALAAVLAIRDGTQYEPLDIRIKWPNDIYYGRSQKIGGISTTASVMGDTARINMGIGVNISNSVPTTCVNDIIREYNASHGTGLEEVRIEWFLGRFCSHFERILDSMTTEEGQKAFFEEYYKYWMHSKEEINVINKDGRRISGVISGMDEHGFLLVNSTTGRLTVNPDGNSFDIMANLIVTKYAC